MEIGNFFASFGRRLGIIGKFFKFLWKKKNWWLIPLVVILLLFALILILGSNPVIAPFIYTLF
jgi:hypothetical protein